MKLQTRLRLMFCVSFYLMGYFAMTQPVSLVMADPGDLDTTFGVDNDGDGVADGYGVYEQGQGLGVLLHTNGNLFVVGTGGCSSISTLAGYVSRVSSTGQLDETFGTSGYISYDNDLSDAAYLGGSEIRSVAEDSSGNVYVTGFGIANGSSDTRLFVDKYDADGTHDTAFHDSAIYDSTAGNDKGNDLVLDQSGRVIVVGQSYVASSDEDSLLAIFDNVGSTVFAGTFTRSTTGKDAFNAVALDYDESGSDYDIVAVGYLENESANKDISVVRLTSSGAFDESFDGDGYLSKDYLSDSAGDDVAEDLAIDSDGNIFITGYITDADSDQDAFIAKYKSDGTIDANFGLDGYVYFDSGYGDDKAFTIALDSTGSVLVGGSMTVDTDVVFFVARYDSTGQIDTNFGDSDGENKKGYVTLNIDASSLTQTFYEIKLDSQENILAVGTLNGDGLGDMDKAILARFEGGYVEAVSTAVCGDGTVDTGEECDDGNVVDGDGCSSLCVTEANEPTCGDNHVDEGEECDDGNFTAGDMCSAVCTLELDDDRDGYYGEADCDDNDASIHEDCASGSESTSSGGGGCGCVISKQNANPFESLLYGSVLMGLALVRFFKKNLAK